MLNLTQALCIPWIRVAYFTLKRLIFRAVLQPPRPPPASRDNDVYLDNTQSGVPHDRQVDTYETLDDGSVVFDDNDDHGVLIEELQEHLLDEDAGIPATIYLSYSGVARFLLGGLVLPFAANAVGSTLGFASRFIPLLAKALGVHGTRIWQSSYLPPSQSHVDIGVSPGLAISTSWSADLPSLYDDLDPVWYRNAIGGGIYILLKDTFTLIYRYMQMRTRRSTRIKDLPFSDGVASELIQNGSAPASAM